MARRRWYAIGWLFGAVCAASSPARADATEGPVVTVETGALRGVATQEVISFKGVPFATPPTGALRWQPPRAPARWQGVRDASRFGAACVQFGPTFLIPRDATQSEDCLTLNVWKPAAPSAKPLPVMVWIHGGAFALGTGSSPVSSGEGFAKRGLVLVTINYRLGRLGFFAHPALSSETADQPLGNYGLLDQVAALRWVRDNIAVFGGDPQRVTIFGESAGGMSVNHLMVAPAARGLFQAAISQSGFGRSAGLRLQRASKPDATVTAESAGDAFAQSVGVQGKDAATAQVLRALPVETLKRPDPPAATGVRNELPYPFIDGVLIPAPPAELFVKGAHAKVPFMLGGTSWEASLFEFSRKDPDGVFARTGDAPRARALYGAKQHGTAKAAQDLVTDAQVTEPSRLLARAAAKHGASVFLYHFSYVPAALRSKVPGAAHGAEIGYVFGNLPRQPITSPVLGEIPAASDEDRKLSERMTNYWAAFARDGAPGTAGGPKWPPLTDKSDVLMEFGVGGATPRRAFAKPRLDWLERVAARPPGAS